MITKDIWCEKCDWTKNKYMYIEIIYAILIWEIDYKIILLQYKTFTFYTMNNINITRLHEITIHENKIQNNQFGDALHLT